MRSRSLIPLWIAWLVLLLFAPIAALAAETPGDEGLTLQHALQRMRAHDPNVAVAQTAIDQAAADKLSAGERPNATLSYSTSGINTAGGNGPGPWWDKGFDTVISLDQPVERGGKRKQRLRQADANLGAAESDYNDTLRQEQLAVAQAYWELKRAQEKRASAQTLDDIEQRALGAAAARLQHGDIANLDVERLHLGAAQADNAVDQAEGALRDAQVALAALLDVTEQASALNAVDSWPAAQWQTPDTDHALAQRPDIAAAEQRTQAAAAALDLAHAQRKRDVTLSGQYEHYPAPFEGHTLLGVGFSVPLFTGNHYEGEIRRADADLDAAQAVLARTEAGARADVRRAIADANAANARVRRYDGDLVERARRVEQTSEAAYARGGLALADLLDARRDLKAVDDEATDARADFAEALAALAAAAPTQESSP